MWHFNIVHVIKSPNLIDWLYWQFAAMNAENRGNGHTWRMPANLIADIWPQADHPLFVWCNYCFGTWDFIFTRHDRLKFLPSGDFKSRFLPLCWNKVSRKCWLSHAWYFFFFAIPSRRNLSLVSLLFNYRRFISIYIDCIEWVQSIDYP